MTRLVRSTACVLALMLLVVACSGEDEPDEVPPIGGEQPEDPGDDDAGDGGTDDAAEAEEPEDEPDPTVVPRDPDNIDLAYAAAVVEALDAPMREALTVTRGQAPLEDGAVPAALADVVFASYHEQWAEGVVRSISSSFIEPTWSENEERLLPPDEYAPESSEATDLEVVDEDGLCLLIEVETDLSGTLREPPDEPSTFGWVLIRREQGADRAVNPTPWMHAVQEVNLDQQTDEFGPDRCDTH